MVTALKKSGKFEIKLGKDIYETLKNFVGHAKCAIITGVGTGVAAVAAAAAIVGTDGTNEVLWAAAIGTTTEIAVTRVLLSKLFIAILQSAGVTGNLQICASDISGQLYQQALTSGNLAAFAAGLMKDVVLLEADCSNVLTKCSNLIDL